MDIWELREGLLSYKQKKILAIAKERGFINRVEIEVIYSDKRTGINAIERLIKFGLLVPNVANTRYKYNYSKEVDIQQQDIGRYV